MSRTVPDRFLAAALPFDVRPGAVAANLEKVLDGMERAAAEGASLLLLPEKWTTSFLPEFAPAVRQASDAALDRVHSRAADLELIVAGSAPAGQGTRPFNEFHLLGAAGSLRPYRKRMLFSPTREDLQNAPGEGPARVVDSPLGRIAGVICYDLRFPEIVRPVFYAGAELMLVPAQWPRPRAGVLDLLARARAAENQCWVLACNRSGAARGAAGGELAFPGTALLADPAGAEAGRTADGALLLAEVDYARMRRVRENVPCLADWRRSSGGSGS